MSYRLFEVFGIELEYMLVAKKDLKVSPIVDQLMILKTGEITSDVDNGPVEWSNELVAHVVELKTNGPTSNLEDLDVFFAENISEINSLLEQKAVKLLPTASHPLMHPETEMQLWKHSYSQIYALYNRIFDCRGHGWSNVQSMHINLPFLDDEEFGKLHAAVRIILPLIPALSASSPIFEGAATGFKDARMEVYKSNQKEIPQMTGKVIPEQAFTKEDYYRQIFEPINDAIKPHDTENILDHHFLNSRGAIARFDRKAIEIRVIDIQECPKADVAIAVLLIETLKLLVGEELVTLEDQKSWNEDSLFKIFNVVIKDAESAIIDNVQYLGLFDIEKPCTAGEIWNKIFTRVRENISAKHRETLEIIQQEGCLSTRILMALDGDFSEENILKVYQQLANCLAENKLFLP